MTIPYYLEDGLGSGNKARVDDEGNQYVVIHPHPPLTANDPNTLIPYSSNFANAGSSAMNVNGATTNVEFSVNADKDKDTYIRTIAITIAGTAPQLREFSDFAALTNGVQLIWSTQDRADVTIANIQRNWDAVRLGLGEPAFGATTNSFLASNVTANNVDAYVPILDTSRIFGFMWGLKLRAGTLDKLLFKVRDNLTSAETFEAVGYGFQINGE